MESGVIVTRRLQLAPAGSVEVQVPARTAKLDAVPQPSSTSASGPSLATVMPLTPLFVPTGRAPNATIAGDTVTRANADVLVNVPATEPMVSVVVTDAPGVALETCRTQTDWPGVIVPAALVNAGAHPIEY